MYVLHASYGTQWIPSDKQFFEIALHSSNVANLNGVHPVKWVHALLTQAHPSVIEQSASRSGVQNTDVVAFVVGVVVSVNNPHVFFAVSQAHFLANLLLVQSVSPLRSVHSHYVKLVF